MDNIYFQEIKRKAVTAIIDMKLTRYSEDVTRINNEFQIWLYNFIDDYPMEHFEENLDNIYMYSEMVSSMCDVMLTVIKLGEEKLQ